MEHTRKIRRTGPIAALVAALAGLAVLALLAGCGGGGADRSETVGGTDRSTTSAPEAGAARTESGSAAAADSSRAGSDSAAAGSDTELVDSDDGRRQARSARLDIEVEDVDEAVDRVRSVAEDVGGHISSERTDLGGDEVGARTTMVVTVPTEDIDATVEALAGIGEVTDRERDSQDLTTRYDDTAARVKTTRASITRLRTLMDDADDLDQVVALERELADREADLESLSRQQASLEQRTSTAPVTVHLTEPPAEDEGGDATGFVVGLKGGWAALTETGAAALTAAGALTPFVAVGALLLGPPAWWLRRRWTRRRAPAVSGS